MKVDRIKPDYMASSILANIEPELTRVSPELCIRGEFQTRMNFSQPKLDELAASVKTTNGNVVPVILRPTPSKTRYEILAGERRIRACIMADCRALALVAEYTDEQAAVITLVENVQRDDLNPIEEANGYLSLIQELSLTQSEVSELTGKSRSHVANFLRLLKLDTMLKDALIANRIEVGHAKMLASLDPPAQRNLLRKITLNQWSVRKLEQHIRGLGVEKPIVKPDTNPDKDIANLEEELSEITGTPVRIKVDKSGWHGELKIQFWGSDQFEFIEERLRGG